MSKDDIKNGLLAVGLEAGDAVLVHSSLKSFGRVDGGAQPVIDALDETVGENGTTLMPGFTRCELTPGWVFDVNNTPVNSTPGEAIGVIAETFRKNHGTIRSLHPSHSILAKGKLANIITGFHHTCPTPFASNSPFENLIKANGKILLIGKDQRINTSVHCFEDRTPNFPYKTYCQTVFEIKMKGYYGEDMTIKTKQFDRSVEDLRDYQNTGGFLVLDERLRANGLMKETTVGNASFRMLKIRDLMFILEGMLKDGITIYTRKL